MRKLVDLVLLIQEKEGSNECKNFRNFINHYGTYERCGSLLHLEEMTELLRLFFKKCNEKELNNLIQELYQRFKLSGVYLIYLFAVIHMQNPKTWGADKENRELGLQIQKMVPEELTKKCEEKFKAEVEAVMEWH